MANNIKFAKNYTSILNEVYQRAAVSRCLNSGGRMVRAGRNAKEILIPKISVTGLGDYTRNVATRRAPSPTSTRRTASATTGPSACSPTSWTSRRAAFWTAS